MFYPKKIKMKKNSRIINNFHHVTLFERHVSKFGSLISVQSHDDLTTYTSGS